MRILLTGGSGQLGGGLRGRLATFGEVLAPPRTELDLGRAAAIEQALAAVRPDLIVNAGAYTDVDGAETNQATAFAVNADAPAAIGRWAAGAGSVVIHVSTDYVFDAEGPGPLTEDDLPAPANVYGHSKLAGERALLATGAVALVLRTAWLYGPTGNNFFRRVIGWARERERVAVVTDQTGSPTTTLWLAGAIATVVRQLGRLDQAGLARRRGIYHAAGDGAASRFGFAQAILAAGRAAGWPLTCRDITPARSADFPTPARRPAFSALSSARFVRAWGVAAQPWQDGVGEVVAASNQP